MNEQVNVVPEISNEDLLGVKNQITDPHCEPEVLSVMGLNSHLKVTEFNCMMILYLGGVRVCLTIDNLSNFISSNIDSYRIVISDHTPTFEEFRSTLNGILQKINSEDKSYASIITLAGKLIDLERENGTGS